jgi:hypothetical protein
MVIKLLLLMLRLQTKILVSLTFMMDEGVDASWRHQVKANKEALDKANRKIIAWEEVHG